MIWHWNSGKDNRLLTQQNYKMLIRRTIMTMTTATTTTTTTTAMKITTLTTTTTTFKQQRFCWEWYRCIRRSVHQMTKRLRKTVMFLRYFWWFLDSSGDPPCHQCVNHPWGLVMGWADAEKGVGCLFLGCTMGYQTHSKKAQENGDISEVFLMFFWFW